MIIISRTTRKINNASFLHVIVQGINKENIFLEERNKKQYLKLFKEKNTHIKVIAYCLMSNHAHFLVQVSKIEELSSLMHKVNGSYARYYNYMKNGRAGYVFRDRFVSEPITSKRYLINCIKYIHMNPVKAGMVKKCEEYKFSSYNYYKDKVLKEKVKRNKIFSNEDIKNIVNNYYTDFVFYDINENKEFEINEGISEFIKKEQINLYEIFLDRIILIDLIKFLKNVRNIKYISIRNFLNMERGTMEGITKKIRENR